MINLGSDDHGHVVLVNSLADVVGCEVGNIPGGPSLVLLLANGRRRVIRIEHLRSDALRSIWRNLVRAERGGAP